ncbi:MOSC domain-containing protein [Yoonia sp. SS1-5]|uniref:MOSC domain-containing protein n=1 Tax=Yoonia rhodophyticola TaxID=3137370 RepID=A0AAN0MA65_9RHOB
MTRVAALWRHPIKSHGREAIETVALTAGQTMPWDRHWAVTHADHKFDQADPRWVMCRNFMITVATPGLAGIWATLDEAAGEITLRHDDLGSHRFNPDDPDQIAGFLAWVMPLCPADQRVPTGIVAVPARGMTDTSFPSISIMNTATHRAVEGRLGRKLEPERWRGNIWLDGPAAWEEFEWTGKTIRIGTAELDIQEPIRRCKATMANPRTGHRDTDTLGILREAWDHQHFGVYATVTKSGTISLNDIAEVL